MKKIAGILLTAVIIALSCACAFADDVIGKTFYTMANIWYEKPDEIPSTNYHRGTMVPAGTKVTVHKLDKSGIEVTDDKGSYRIVLVKKHMNRKQTEKDYFNQYFSTENPMKKGGPFQGFSDKEKANIKAGKLEKGMSKEAVLMAYGYPPSHRTPSIESDRWVYWINRIVNFPISFEKGRVSDIGSSYSP